MTRTTLKIIDPITQKCKLHTSEKYLTISSEIAKHLGVQAPDRVKLIITWPSGKKGTLCGNLQSGTEFYIPSGIKHWFRPEEEILVEVHRC